MSHKIEISDKTYEVLKDFCTLNKIKIGQFVDKTIYDQLMIEMYGNTPFTNYGKIKKEEILEKTRKEFPPEKFEEEYLSQPEPKDAEPEKTTLIQFQTDTVSENGRYHPKEVVEKAVEEYNEKLKEAKKPIKRRLK